MKTLSHNSDIIIVGGGMVGLALACGLRSTGKKITVIDAQPIDQLHQRPPCPDAPPTLTEPAPAFSAINKTSQRLLNDWGVWSAIQAQGANPFKTMVVWDAKSKGTVRFTCDSLNASNMGHIIQNQMIRRGLLSVLKLSSNVQLLSSVTLADTPGSVVVNDHTVSLTLSNGQQLNAELVVGADGAHSALRQCIGIDHYQRSYGQTALTATVAIEHPHQMTAWQHFLPNGPLAFLPLSDRHQCSIVWSTTPKQAAELIAMSTEAFNHALTLAFEKRLGQVKRLSALSHYPLTLRHAKQYTTPCIALVGDAIHTIHPLAGQGVNLGLKDVAELINCLQQSIQRNQSLGHSRGLRAYERARKGDNWLTIGVMELFKRLFSDVPYTLIALRGLGLTVTDRLDCIKRLVMN